MILIEYVIYVICATGTGQTQKFKGFAESKTEQTALVTHPLIHYIITHCKSFSTSIDVTQHYSKQLDVAHDHLSHVLLASVSTNGLPASGASRLACRTKC
jgi:transcriptional regulatory protein LevR